MNVLALIFQGSGKRARSAGTTSTTNPRFEQPAGGSGRCCGKPQGLPGTLVYGTVCIHDHNFTVRRAHQPRKLCIIHASEASLTELSYNGYREILAAFAASISTIYPVKRRCVSQSIR